MYNSSKKTILTFMIIFLSIPANTAYAFPSKSMECGVNYGLPSLLVALISGIIAIIKTVLILSSKEKNKKIRILKWWIVPLGTMPIAMTIIGYCPLDFLEFKYVVHSLLLALIVGFIAIIKTIDILSSEEKNKKIRILKWWIVPLGAFFIAIILIYINKIFLQ